MKIYIGRIAGGRQVALLTVDGQHEGLDPRHDLRNHSPTGFAWGYGGSGPLQLALAICADLLDDDKRALRVYQKFKEKHIATLDMQKGWMMADGQVRDRIEAIEEGE